MAAKAALEHAHAQEVVLKCREAGHMGQRETRDYKKYIRRKICIMMRMRDAVSSRRCNIGDVAFAVGFSRARKVSLWAGVYAGWRCAWHIKL